MTVQKYYIKNKKNYFKIAAKFARRTVDCHRQGRSVLIPDIRTLRGRSQLRASGTAYLLTIITHKV